MTKKEWTIIGVLGAAVVVALACLGGVMLMMLTATPRPTGQVAVSDLPSVTPAQLPTQLSATQVKPTTLPQPKSTATPKDVYLKEINCVSGKANWMGNDNVYCLVVYYNPNDYISGVEATINFLDSKGVSFGEEHGWWGENLFPKETRKEVISHYIPWNKKYGSFSVELSTISPSVHPSDELTRNTFIVSDIKIFPTTGDVFATITNTSSKSITDVIVYFVFYDKNGQFTGGYSGSVFRLLPGGKGTASVQSDFWRFEEVSRVEVYPSIPPKAIIE